MYRCWSGYLWYIHITQNRPTALYKTSSCKGQGEHRVTKEPESVTYWKEYKKGKRNAEK